MFTWETVLRISKCNELLEDKSSTCHLRFLRADLGTCTLCGTDFPFYSRPFIMLQRFKRPSETTPGEIFFRQGGSLGSIMSMEQPYTVPTNENLLYWSLTESNRYILYCIHERYIRDPFGLAGRTSSASGRLSTTALKGLHYLYWIVSGYSLFYQCIDLNPNIAISKQSKITNQLPKH